MSFSFPFSTKLLTGIMRLCVGNENNDIKPPTSHTITNRLGWTEARDATCLEPQVSFFFLLNDCSIRLLCHGIGTTSSSSDHHHTPVQWADDGELLATIYDHMHSDALKLLLFFRLIFLVLYYCCTISIVLIGAMYIFLMHYFIKSMTYKLADSQGNSLNSGW